MHAGGMGGRGTLLRAPLVYQGAHGPPEAVAKPGTTALGADSKAAAQPTPFAAAGSTKRGAAEPTVEEATIKAAALFRPGSSICIGRCGSPKPQSLNGSDRLAAAAGHAGNQGMRGAADISSCRQLARTCP